MISFLRAAAACLLMATALGCASLREPERGPAITVAHGRVLNPHWRPVGGARATLSIDGQGQVGTGTADADGYFTFALAKHRQIGEDPVLAVEADGFLPWSQRISWKDLTDCRVKLDRKIDAAYMAELRSISDPAQRTWRMEEILSGTDWDQTLADLFPFVGELRDDLIAASARPPASPEDKMAENALALLAFWNDPRDRERLTPWVAQNPFYHLSPEPVKAPSPEEFCQAWASVHFAHEHIKGRDWPPYYCSQPRIDASQTHALILFEVRYTYWRYNMYLVVTRDGKDQPWRLRTLVDNLIT